MSSVTWPEIIKRMIFSCMHFSSVVEMLNHDGKLQFMKPFLVYV